MSGVRYQEILQMAEDVVADVESPNDVGVAKRLLKGLRLKSIDYDRLDSLLDDLQRDMEL